MASSWAAVASTKFSLALFKLSESLFFSFYNASNLALRASRSNFAFFKASAWTELASKAALSEPPETVNSFFYLATSEAEPLESSTLNTLANARSWLCISKQATTSSLVDVVFIAPLSTGESEMLTPLWNVRSWAKSWLALLTPRSRVVGWDLLDEWREEECFLEQSFLLASLSVTSGGLRSTKAREGGTP